MVEQERAHLRWQAQRWFSEPDRRVVSHAYDVRETVASQRLMIEIALAELGRQPQAVLDVGSGDGAGLAYLAARCPDARLTGIDPSDCAAHNPGEFSELNGRDALLLTAAAEDFGDEVVERGPFDLVLAHLNWALWSQPFQGVDRLVTLLADDGLMYIVDLDGQPDSAATVLASATTPREEAYLTDQVAASLSAAEAAAGLRSLGPAHDVSVQRGGLGGHAFASAECRRLMGSEAVRRVLSGFPATETSKAADAVLHVRVRRRAAGDRAEGPSGGMGDFPDGGAWRTGSVEHDES